MFAINEIKNFVKILRNIFIKTYRKGQNARQRRDYFIIL